MIITLAIVLVLALLLGMAAHRLHLSPLVGYLVAGILASVINGCYHDANNADLISKEMMHEFSEMGVILLLFGVGLQFHIKDLLAVWKVAVPGAGICMFLWTLIGAFMYYFFSHEPHSGGCFLYGICVCVSSTVVLVRVLSDNRMLQTPAGHTALGWLVVEDIFTIVLLVLLPVLFGDSDQSVWSSLGNLAWQLPLLVFIIAFVGRKVLPYLLGFVSKEKSGELFTLAVLAIALGLAVLAAKGFGASMAFGAFLSGMVVGQSKFSFRAASDALPMRDAFAVLFFVAVGYGFKIDGFVAHWELALGTFGLVVLFGPVSAYIVMRMLGKNVRTSIILATSLAQIGEFSFILAADATDKYHLITPDAAAVITGVAIVTITLNAVFYRFVPKLIAALERRGVGAQANAVTTDASAVPEISEDKHRVIVVGYGPCGRILTGILRDNNVEVVVIEMNINTVEKLGELGIPAIHGDARLRSILIMAGVEKARGLIVTSALAPAAEIVSMAHTLNEKINIMAHTSFLRSVQEVLVAKGANAESAPVEGANAVKVFSGEEEVALGMMTAMLRDFGVPEEQVQHERQQARELLNAERRKTVAPAAS